nr:hypothetical protein [Pandoravirus massiliensis]
MATSGSTPTTLVNGTGNSEPGWGARALFSSVVADPTDFDPTVAWPSDPDAMMRAHYPMQSWPVRGPLDTTISDGISRPSVCAIIGGTDSMRALAVHHVAARMGSSMGEPYAAITAVVHPTDRTTTAVGRALTKHTPPSCLHADIKSWENACTQPPMDDCRGRRLFLAYVSPHTERAYAKSMYAATMHSRHRQCDLVMVFEETCLARPCLRAQFDAVTLLPPLAVPLDKFVGEDDRRSLIRDLLAQDRPVRFCYRGLTVTPLDALQRIDDLTDAVQDRFHTHVAWRMHYALNRASSLWLRNTQKQLRTHGGVPTLTQMSARACLGHLDAICDANVPAECLSHIADAAALWIDLVDDSPTGYAAMGALRQFMEHLTRLCAGVDTTGWSTVTIVRHLLDVALRRTIPYEQPA